jgi:hydrogenase assembly chaperone HypC/HupF
MCLAFPGRVVDLDVDGAIVETEGRRRRASTLFLPDVAVGDWVTVAGGTIVGRLEPEDAAEIQQILRAAIALESGHQPAAGVSDHRGGAPDVHSF